MLFALPPGLMYTEQPGLCIALVRDEFSVQGPRLASMARQLHAAATAPAAQPLQVGCRVALCQVFQSKFTIHGGENSRSHV